MRRKTVTFVVAPSVKGADRLFSLWLGWRGGCWGQVDETQS